LLIILGICATIPQSQATNYAQAVLGILISFVFAGTLGPISYSIIAETSSVRLRALSTGVGRAAYYVAEIPMIYLASRMLNPSGWNMAVSLSLIGRGLSFVWAGPVHLIPPYSKQHADILLNQGKCGYVWVS
jgi:SP family general alpha glucoside:H+ symporter-like MFS transporter